MSIRMMSLVWESNLAPEQKYILLKMADYADDEGEHVYPSVARVARLTGVSERTVQRHLSAMRDEGILEVVNQATQHKPTEYRIRGDKLTPLEESGVTPVTARGDTGVVSGVTPMSPYPSYNRQEPPAARAKNLPFSDPIKERLPDAVVERWLISEAEKKWGKSAVKKARERYGDRFHLWSKSQLRWETGSSLRDCMEQASQELAMDDFQREKRDEQYAIPIDPDIHAATVRRHEANKAIERALGLEMAQ